MPRWTLPLDDPRLDLAAGGGKAVNLGILTRAGLPVPGGFVVTTDAYRRHVREHRLDDLIGAVLSGLGPDDPAALEEASSRLRTAFRATPVASELADEIGAAYRGLDAGHGDPPVAVRSSATAEDLADASFAGQQDTFLQVLGEDAVVDAVRDCWSSLWTARAIAYRRRNDIDDAGAAVGVVVQRMIPAEVSGVLFTANPLTGHRGELVVDATFGLGEALVSGQVEPDHLVVDRATGRVISRTIGAKAVATVGDSSGGVHTVECGATTTSALTDAQVLDLAALGRRIEARYAAPQDIEWALTDGRLHVLQSRAITSLHPLPEGAPQESVWFSFGAVQGMLDPITPLGRDALRCILAGAARLTGHPVDPLANPFLGVAGERLWIRVDRALTDPVGRRVIGAGMPIIDPSAARIVAGLRDEPFVAPPSGLVGRLDQGRRRARTLGSLARLARRALPKAPSVFRHPTEGRDGFDAAIVELVARARAAEARAAAEPDPVARLAARARALRESLLGAFPVIAPWAGPMVAPPVAALRLLGRLVAPDDASPAPAAGRQVVPPAVLELTRAVPRNPTTEMDLALWDAAEIIAADPASRTLVGSGDPADRAARYLAGSLPAPAQAALDAFLAAYGMRGVGEIDLGRPRWREDPTDIVATVASYLRLPPEQAPREVFRRGEQAAARAGADLVARASGMPHGRLRAAVVRMLVSRIRALIGAREQPKFAVVQIMGVFREGLLASGRDLVDLGVLDAADDVFFLGLAELTALDSGDAAGLSALRGLVAQRRAAAAVERRRTRIPRVLVGDGRSFHEGVGADADEGAVVGSPVSPGVVEGIVRVVRDPAGAGLQPGEILVCVGTDPAWTPLFLTAVGLVTEVGGMMTHGSVVAREYGIPAVVGVHEATTRLATGQRIRLDGSVGTITLLE